MKTKKITLLLFVAFLGINTAFAETSILNPIYWGFEGEVYGSETAQNGWYYTPYQGISNYAITNEKAATGTYSLKFYIDPVSSATFNTYAQCIGGPSNGPVDAQINMAAGQYVLTFKAYLPDDCPNAIQFWIQPGSSTTNVIAFKLGGLQALEKNKWLTLTAIDNGTNTTPTTLAAAISGHKMQIAIPKSQMTAASGSATIYIDDIVISTYVPSAVNAVNESFECTVFSNRTNNMLNVNAPEASTVRIINTLGAVLSTYQNPTGKLVVPASKLSTGIYFVEISSQGEKVVKKISL